MPLQHPYGVVIGTLERYIRDDKDEYGKYLHDNVYVNTPKGVYHCAVDVDSKFLTDGINWRIVQLETVHMKGIFELEDGWHELASNSTSGALDNIRTQAFHRTGCAGMIADPILRILKDWFNLYVNPPWKGGTSLQAMDKLEPLLDDSKRLFIFGEHFHYGGLGVHNIHQNQGDPYSIQPPGAQWWKDSGIWQDGGVIIEKNDGLIVAFLTKFKPQSDKTDDKGHPAS